MPAELDLLLRRQPKHALEVLPNSLKPLRRRLLVSASISVLALWSLAGSPGPQADTPERLADVDDDSHHFVVLVIFQHLADGSEHDVQPGLVTRLAVLEGVMPATTVLVLDVFPFWTHALLEEMVVGLLREL